MTSQSDTITRDVESALDAIQFFANSANSVRVFEALTNGLTTSSDLAEQTAASRSTVARILDEGESRGWINSEGSQYELTELGEAMIDEFRVYLQTLDGIQHLGDAVGWLPPPARSLDFRHLRTADIITPAPPTPSGPYDYVAEMIRTVDEIRSLVEVAMPRYVKLIDQQCRERQLSDEIVIEASWFETFPAESEQVSLWQTRAERNSVWTYEGDIPINMHIFDGSVGIWLGEKLEDDRVVRGLLATENSTVVSWAESLYEDFRAEADQLDPAILSET